MSVKVQRLTARDLPLYRKMMHLFGAAFEDMARYTEHPPTDAYVTALLGKPDFFAFAACDGPDVIGALAGYQLVKFEQETSELYIYDLAVVEAHRRQGVATALIASTQQLASELGAEVIFVQADYVDPPAIALYTKLGTREEVLHFDIPPA